MLNEVNENGAWLGFRTATGFSATNLRIRKNEQVRAGGWGVDDIYIALWSLRATADSVRWHLTSPSASFDAILQRNL
jgi:hypothetical protein